MHRIQGTTIDDLRLTIYDLDPSWHRQSSAVSSRESNRVCEKRERDRWQITRV